MPGENSPSNINTSTSTTTTDDVVVSGILFSRSVRATFCSLSLVPVQRGVLPDNNDNNSSITDDVPAAVCMNTTGTTTTSCTATTPLLVRIQFFDQVTEIRSFCRRSYKLGDWMEIRNGTWDNVATTTTTTTGGGDSDYDAIMHTEWKQPRMVIDISNTEAAKEYLTVVKSQYWNMSQCQQWQQRRFFPCKANDKNQSTKRSTTIKKKKQKPGLDGSSSSSPKANNPHGGSLGKRAQAEHIAKFLIASIMHKLSTTGNYTSCSNHHHHLCENDKQQQSTDFSWLKDPSKWSTWDTKVLGSTLLYKQAMEYMNSGSGVLDVAGGSGHISMVLGMMGVHSTVVDARKSVGKLPRSDRKIWNRAITNNKRASSVQVRVVSGDDETAPSSSGLESYCLPVVPFQAFRGWFGVVPTGVDSTFRHPDNDTLPVCDETSDLLVRASAIVALHPDEATGDIVRLAVHRQKPLVVVPCCVFARLFPDRKLTTIHHQSPEMESSKVVSTYDDLLQFLKGQDPRISQTELPFDGKNTVLWSTFD